MPPNANVSPAPSPTTPARPAWIPWALPAAAIAWVVLVRIPLVLNAESHLDSDLAVDGITLREALGGQWRWHYPGTPHMGILPVLYSIPQAMFWGASPITLVSGGTIAFSALVAASFLLALRGFGPETASWGLVPLAFGSSGAIWLSGRVTGGHLTAATWHAVAFVLLYANLARGGPRRALALGLWCGLGIYLDSLFFMTLAGLLPAAVGGWWVQGRSRVGVVAALVFLSGFLAAGALREVGSWIDPHDAYREQFLPVFDRGVLEEHARILALECVPRLIAGHRLPGFQADPDPLSLTRPGPVSRVSDLHPIAVAGTILSLVLFLGALGALFVPGREPGGVPAAAVRWGLVVSALATAIGFILNRNIFNSDNYRYLVGLLVPWSLGFGLMMRRLARKGGGGLAASTICAVGLAALMTLDTARWYSRFGWIDTAGRPVREVLHDPGVAWLGEHREVTYVLGGYWDVYRWSFLAPRRVFGVPYPIYPDRFPEWSRGTAGGQRRVVIARNDPEGATFVARAIARGGRVLRRSGGLNVVTWP